MSHQHLLLFNGPPGSGKDTAARIVCDNKAVQGYWRRHIDRFSMPLKTSICSWLNIKVDFLGVSALDTIKDTPNRHLNYYSYRQAQINLAKHMKEQYGDKILGTLLAARCDRMIEGEQKPVLICVPDSGFIAELIPLLDVFKPNEITLVELHAEGRDFRNDNRNYLDPKIIKTMDIKHVMVWNPMTHGGFEDNLKEQLPHIFVGG